MMTIENFMGPHRWLSNFYLAEVVLDAVIYPSVEHAYQAAKFPEAERGMFISGTPGEAKRRARAKPGLRSDWDDVKVDIMRDLVRQKFTNHPRLKQALLETGNAQLVEGNYWGDTFWGVCRGQGQNWLGKILMEVRQELHTA